MVVAQMEDLGLVMSLAGTDLPSRDPLKPLLYLERENTSSEQKITVFPFRKTQGDVKDTEDSI